MLAEEQQAQILAPRSSTGIARRLRKKTFDWDLTPGIAHLLMQIVGARAQGPTVVFRW